MYEMARNVCQLLLAKKLHFGKFTTIKRKLFVTGRCMAGPFPVDHENEYYRQALGKLSPHYCSPPFINQIRLNDKIAPKTELFAKLDHTDNPPETLHKTFVSLSKSVYHQAINTTVEDPEYKPVCVALANVFSNLTDEQLCEVLACLTLWPPTPSIKSPSYKTLWNALDRECSARSSKWDSTRLLQVAYGWYELGINRITNYNYTMIDVLCSRIDALDLHTLTHLLFFINLQRKISAKLMIQIENQLLSRDIEHLELDELGVIALGYFKTQTIITSTALITKILTKVQNSFPTLNSFNITSIAKVVRYSLLNKNDCLEECKIFQRKSLKYLPSFTPPTILHLALLSIRHVACDEDLLKYMMETFVQDLKSLRLKELSQSLFCISHILPGSEQSRDYARKLVDELLLPHRQHEMSQFPHQLISLNVYASYMNVYSTKLIDHCLSDEFLKQAEDNSNWEWEREAYVLDVSVGLECPNYQGNRMSGARKSAIYKRNLDNRLSSQQNILIADVSKNIATVLGGQSFCRICQILPHFHHKEIIVMQDKNGVWKQVASVLQQKPVGSILEPPTKDKWFAIFVGGRNFYSLTNKQLVGSYRMKCRQLQKLGYTVIEVPHHEYFRLNNSRKIEYLREKLMVKDI